MFVEQAFSLSLTFDSGEPDLVSAFSHFVYAAPKELPATRSVQWALFSVLARTRRRR